MSNLGKFSSCKSFKDSLLAGFSKLRGFSALNVNDSPLATQEPQTITLEPIPDQSLANGSYTLVGSASSNLSIIYSFFGSSSVATLSGNTITFHSAGAVSIVADQPGSSNYYAAPTITQNFSIINVPASQQAQSVNFPSQIDSSDPSISTQELSNTIQANSKFRIKSYFAIDSSGNEITKTSANQNIDPEAAFYGPDGSLISTNDDTAGESYPRNLLPSFTLNNGVAAGVYFMCISRYNTSYSSNYATTQSGDLILDFPIDVKIEYLDENNNVTFTAAVINFTPDASTKHLWVSCTIV